MPYQRDYSKTFSLFDHTWAVFRSHYAWHLLMLVMICTKYRKNPLTTVAHSINKFVANLITSTTRVLKQIYLKVSNLTAPLKRSGWFFWSWNNFDWIRLVYQFCIKICHFIQFVWCEKATDQILSLYSLSSKTSYCKISWSIEAMSFGFRLEALVKMVRLQNGHT